MACPSKDQLGQCLPQHFLQAHQKFFRRQPRSPRRIVGGIHPRARSFVIFHFNGFHTHSLSVFTNLISSSFHRVFHDEQVHESKQNTSRWDLYSSLFLLMLIVVLSHRSVRCFCFDCLSIWTQKHRSHKPQRAKSCAIMSDCTSPS